VCNCLSALNDPIWKWILSIAFLESVGLVLFAKRSQQLVTGQCWLRLGSARGHLVSGMTGPPLQSHSVGLRLTLTQPWDRSIELRV